MYTTKPLIRSVVALGLVAVLSGYVLAEGQSHERMSDQPYQWGRGQQQSYSSTMDTRLDKASELIGSPVKNPQGQRLGTIYDLVLTHDLDSVEYMALSRGGLFGIGRNLYAIPWSELRLGAGGDCIVPISEEELTQWRGFRPSAWPDNVTRSWVGEEPQPEATQTTEEKRAVLERRASRILGSTAKTPEDLNAGTIDDMVINMDTGHVQYAVVSFGGFLGLGEKFAVVPSSAIELSPDQRVARLNVGRDVLRENSFAAGQFPDLGNPSYARNIQQAYGTTGAGETVLGYVPAEEPTRERTTPETRAPEATQRKPETGRTEALKINPEARFDPAAIKTFEGTVMIVGKSAGMAKGSEILLLQVQIDAGKLLTVHAGPLNYVSKQDFYAVRGDHVSVTGAPVEGHEDSAILAARIQKDDQTLTLRNREGHPLWEHSAGTGRQEQTGAATRAPEKNTEGSPREDTSEHMHETPMP